MRKRASEEVKAGIAHGRLPSLPEFEDILREAGFSKSQAAVIANRGLKHLIDRSESGGEGGNPSGLKAALDNFVLPTIGSI
jgi:hypothetical protein